MKNQIKAHNKAQQNKSIIMLIIASMGMLVFIIIGMQGINFRNCINQSNGSDIECFICAKRFPFAIDNNGQFNFVSNN